MPRTLLIVLIVHYSAFYKHAACSARTHFIYSYCWCRAKMLDIQQYQIWCHYYTRTSLLLYVGVCVVLTVLIFPYFEQQYYWSYRGTYAYYYVYHAWFSEIIEHQNATTGEPPGWNPPLFFCITGVCTRTRIIRSNATLSNCFYVYTKHQLQQKGEGRLFLPHLSCVLQQKTKVSFNKTSKTQKQALKIHWK